MPLPPSAHYISCPLQPHLLYISRRSIPLTPQYAQPQPIASTFPYIITDSYLQNKKISECCVLFNASFILCPAATPPIYSPSFRHLVLCHFQGEHHQVRPAGLTLAVHTHEWLNVVASIEPNVFMQGVCALFGFRFSRYCKFFLVSLNANFFSKYFKFLKVFLPFFSCQLLPANKVLGRTRHFSDKTGHYCIHH